MEEPAVELKASLEWRRASARFRREVQDAASGRLPADTADLLQGAVGGLARLASRAAQAGRPAGDRLRLESLRERIAAWLGDDPAGDPATGLALRQELLELSRLLPEVDRTPEMIEHDRGLVAKARRELARTGAPVLPPVVRVFLDGLFGLDDELDRLLERRRVTPADLAPVLARISEELSQPGETVH
jgi:hypothetical protein